MRLITRVVMGFTRPRCPILGAVPAGEIEATGGKVTRFHAGDAVWAFTTLRMGCYAQRICLPATLKLLTPRRRIVALCGSVSVHSPRRLQ